MSYLHAHKIIHRDLKPDNILMDDMLFPKISDFGFSKRLHSDKSITIQSQAGFKGTPIYIPPESLQTNEQTESGDVYAFAMIMYNLLTNEIPFKELTDFQQLYIKVLNGERPSFNTIIDQAYKDLIERCWSQDPKDRPTFAQIVEELENNHDFITPSIDEDDFLNYVEFVNEYEKCFKEKKIIQIDDFIKNHATQTFKKIDIRRYIEEQQNGSFFSRLFKPEKLYPADDLIELSEKCQHLVTQAENDPEKQFHIGTYLIEGKNGFPKKIDLGVKYLERSISGKFIESTIYLSKMLIDGEIIPKNIKKAKKYLSKYLNSKDLRIFALYARILFKENNYKESRKYFEICAKEGEPYSMYKYAMMLLYGLGGNKNIDDAMFYFNSSKSKGFHKSEVYLAALLIYDNNESFWNLPTETQSFIIRQIIKYNKDNDESNVSFTLKKVHMKLKDTQMLSLNKSFLSDDFKALMSNFKEIEAEIVFSSKQFKSILNFFYKLNINIKTEISVFIRDVNSISNKFGPDSKINKIIIDESVKKIEPSTFENCYSLREIALSSSVAMINDYTFCGCSLLKQITIPLLVTKIGNFAFNGCSSLRQLTIPYSVKFIGKHAFDGCALLEQITIPPDVTSIEDYAFNGCKNLNEITFPSSLKSIGDHSFDGCSSLEQISIPSSVITIGNSAFYNCESLKEVTIPALVSSLGEYSFFNCHLMTRVSFISPSKITSIQTYSFAKCSSLTEITIPSSVESIDHFAFKNCRQLREVTIQGSINKIESDAFLGCALPASSLLAHCPQSSQLPIIFKIIILGESCVGKSAILLRYAENRYPEMISQTIGLDLKTKYIDIDGNKVKLLLYDTSGCENYRGIYIEYFKRIDCAIFVIDLANSNPSFDFVIGLFKTLLEKCGQIPVAFLGNKCDIKKENQYVIEEIAKLQEEYDFKYFEVSAKDNINIEQAFQYIATEVYNKRF
ncbi:hypothetical protein M9Y10_031116 [Tritrichomonas musculus]|uniref:Protein kinase domain-containing protein n=1 Tax=Tritrichomonas musculus TaxID=1915356 RepID=A0ABR2H1Z6_9EUKA